VVAASAENAITICGSTCRVALGKHKRIQGTD